MVSREKPDYFMRFLLAIFAILVAVIVVPEHKHATGEHETETLYASHSCANGHWYYVDSDADSVTVSCYLPDTPEAASSATK
jgi:hypothetical protein